MESKQMGLVVLESGFDFDDFFWGGRGFRVVF